MINCTGEAEVSRSDLPPPSGRISTVAVNRPVVVLGVRRATATTLREDGAMTEPDLDPHEYPPIDPREPAPDDAGELLSDAPTDLPDAPVEPMPDDGDDGDAGVREPA
jgi:hypothetical protein